MRVNRKQEILDAALNCFNASGIAATSIEQIQKTSGASIGSIYHHFGSKDGIAFTLYVDGLRGYHQELMAGVAKATTAEKKIKTFVTIFLDWVETNPELASYIFSARSYLINSSKANEISEFHSANGKDTALIISELAEKKQIKKMPSRLYTSLLVGSVQHFAQFLIKPESNQSFTKEKTVLAQAVWDSLAPESV